MGHLQNDVIRGDSLVQNDNPSVYRVFIGVMVEEEPFCVFTACS